MENNLQIIEISEGLYKIVVNTKELSSDSTSAAIIKSILIPISKELQEEAKKIKENEK